jgi:hypothetical protein
MADRKVLVGDVDGLTGIIAHGAFNAGDKLRDPADNTILRPGPFFGDGSLGDVTISTNTTITTPRMYNNLSIADGVTVTVGSYFSVLGKLTMGNGAKIVRNGNDAVGRTAGAAGTVLYYGVGQSGGNGRLATTGGGNGFTGSPVSRAFGGSGGSGGNAGARTGGSGGSPTPPTALEGGRTALMNVSRLTSGLVTTKLGAAWKFNGGAGGGGGAVESTVGEAGGGGGGGHVIVVFAHEIVVPVGTATISANGGNGANAVSGDAGGGGGGGGGCVVVVSSFDQPAGLIVQALGGTGGTGIGAGLAGTNGAAGTASYRRFN